MKPAIGSSVFALATIGLLLCGCAKKMMTYEEALPLFKVGMTMEETKKVFGDPSLTNQLGEQIVWDYSPADRLKPPVSEINGFDLFFRGGVAYRISKNTLVAK